jgi:hypothetical protein
MNVPEYFIEYFKDTPEIIQIVLGISVFLGTVILILILFLKFLRSHLRNNERVERIYSAKYETELVTYIYSGNEDEEISPEQLSIIQRLKKNDTDTFKRAILVKTLLKLKNEIVGEMAVSIQHLYVQTGLMDHAIKMLKSKKWEIIAKGINELTHFHIKEVNDLIIKFINHPKRQIRKETQLYAVKLFNFEGLNFLDQLESDLSEWDQIQLLEVLQKYGQQQPFDVKPWLSSTNESVISFALKLTEIYDQFDAQEELLALLKHPTEKIRIEAIQVLNYFGIFEAKPILIANFKKAKSDEQVAIFKMIENTYDAEDENFIIENTIHPNFEIKLIALKIFKKMNFDYFTSFKQTTANPDCIKIINFLENK